MNRNPFFHGLALLGLGAALALLLAACRQSNATVAGGGIGGTGKGTITNLSVPASTASLGAGALGVSTGSITLNGTRTFTTTVSTRFQIDDADVTAGQLSAVATGLVARVDVGDDVNAAFTSGTAVTIAGEHAVIGPVTSTSPLQVLGQTVLVTHATNQVVSASSLAVGDRVAVSGDTAADGVIQATRLERTTPGAAWRLTGTASNVGASSFTIGGQTVLFEGHPQENCGSSGLTNGSAVTVAAADDSSFVAGDGLTTTTSVRCVNPGVEVPPGLTSGTIPVQLEGFVSSVTTSGGTVTAFVLSGQTVQLTAQTTFGEGKQADLQVGTRAEVTGSYDVSSGVLAASEVDFSEQRVHIVAPLDAASSSTLTLLGLTVHVTALTEDSDHLIGGGESLPVQVQLDGFWDGSQIYATDLAYAENSTAAYSHVEVQGPVTATGSSTLTLMGGLTVNLNNMCLGGSDEEGGGCTTSISQFLSGLPSNPLVDVQDAYFDGSQVKDNGGNGTTTISLED